MRQVSCRVHDLKGLPRSHRKRPRGSTICVDALTELPGTAAAAGRARRWTSQQLQAWFPHHDELADDLAVVVSELVTNAVEAGAVLLSVTLRAHIRGVDVAVADDAPGLPRSGDAAAGDTSGRGLAIVRALAASWEVVPVECGVGKTVWATLVAQADGQFGFDCTASAA